jgi:hypothetical protein
VPVAATGVFDERVDEQWALEWLPRHYQPLDALEVAL